MEFFSFILRRIFFPNIYKNVWYLQGFITQLIYENVRDLMAAPVRRFYVIKVPLKKHLIESRWDGIKDTLYSSGGPLSVFASLNSCLRQRQKREKRGACVEIVIASIQAENKMLRENFTRAGAHSARADHDLYTFNNMEE